MPLRIIPYARGDDLPLIEAELQDLRTHGKSGCKDEGRLRAVIERCWATNGFNCTQLSYRPIEGKPYEKKLWEARYLRSARSDGVHGYRIFYMLARDPKRNEQVVVLLMLFAKEGDTTPKAVLDRAWQRYKEVEKLILDGTFFDD